LSAITLQGIAYGTETNKTELVNLKPMLISARGFETAIDFIPGGAGRNFVLGYEVEF